MALPDIMRSISERLHSTATVNVVYGDLVTVEGKTVIPAARVKYGFGGGFGEGKSPTQDESDGAESEGSGGGDGGGVEVVPIGIIEITSEGTRFISFEDKRRIVKAVTICLLAGMVLLWRWTRR